MSACTRTTATAEVMSRPSAVSVPALLLAFSTALPAQTVLPPGEWVSGSLDSSDSVDADGYVYDAYHLPPDLGGLVRVTLESTEFDTYLEWGVMGGGRFMVVTENDDFEGLGSPTDSRAYAPVGLGERPVIRVFSLDGEASGSYRIRVDGVAESAAEAALLEYGADMQGELAEGDAFVDGSFVDRYRFRGGAGDAVRMVLEADFDAYLRVFGPDGAVVAEDDDSFGDTDAYLEMEVPEDGIYEVEVRSFLTGFGTYRYRMGPELDVEPPPPPADVVLTDEERSGLRYDDQRVWNEALGFDFPSPGADFVLMDEAAVVEVMGEGAPNVHMWMFQDALETAQLMVMAIKAPAAPDSSTVRLIGQTMVESTGGTLLDEEVMWEASRAVFVRFVAGDEEAEMYCAASPGERPQGLILCLMGVSTDGWSFKETMSGLEIH